MYLWTVNYDSAFKLGIDMLTIATVACDAFAPRRHDFLVIVFTLIFDTATVIDTVLSRTRVDVVVWHEDVSAFRLGLEAQQPSSFILVSTLESGSGIATEEQHPSIFLGLSSRFSITPEQQSTFLPGGPSASGAGLVAGATQHAVASTLTSVLVSVLPEHAWPPAGLQQPPLWGLSDWTMSYRLGIQSDRIGFNKRKTIEHHSTK
jgi:hypothetical protein